MQTKIVVRVSSEGEARGSASVSDVYDSPITGEPGTITHTVDVDVPPEIKSVLSAFLDKNAEHFKAMWSEAAMEHIVAERATAKKAGKRHHQKLIE